MRKKIIEKNLKNALLNNGSFEKALFEYELEEHVGEYIQSKREDKDEYFFAITEHTNDVAMLLIDESDSIYINEDARFKLKKIWGAAYNSNIKKIIPEAAKQLNAGYLYAVGVRTGIMI